MRTAKRGERGGLKRENRFCERPPEVNTRLPCRKRARLRRPRWNIRIDRQSKYAVFAFQAPAEEEKKQRFSQPGFFEPQGLNVQ